MKLARHRRWVAVFSVVTLVALSTMAYQKLVPQLPGGLRSGQSAAVWYVQSSQWRADLRTAAAAVNYLFNPAFEARPHNLGATNRQVADRMVAPAKDPA